MTTGASNTATSYVYVGLAGETAPGREVQSGLYRMAEGDSEWTMLRHGLPEAPEIRAIAVHPVQPELVYVGTQNGPYRSTDHGEHWEKVNVPDHGLPVWSILFHPHDPNLMYAGYENCEIYRSEDRGEHWQALPVSVRFPEITMARGANPAKRVLMLDGSASDANIIYGAVEVGGMLRSMDGGEHWENLSHGQYLNDDVVDTHGVLVSRLQPGKVFGIARAGMFCSTDDGDHWQHVRIDALNDKGQTYCRDIRAMPGNPRKIWVAAGANFQSHVGVLFHSKDGGDTWNRVDMGMTPSHTMFALAFDERRPSRMFCATNGGEVYGSTDAGETWQSHPLPEDARLIYALACG
jgi:photosystem II stability/assembly factor-like uncharacterized protein